jgi:hypothetical protein
LPKSRRRSGEASHTAPPLFLPTRTPGPLSYRSPQSPRTLSRICSTFIYVHVCVCVCITRRIYIKIPTTLASHLLHLYICTHIYNVVVRPNHHEPWLALAPPLHIIYIYMCVCVCVFACVCVCVCVNTHTHTHNTMCACVRERQTDRERERERVYKYLAHPLLCFCPKSKRLECEPSTLFRV